MVAAVRAVPGMRATFNLVPSLVEQVEAYAAERTWDRHLVLGLAEAETVPAADAAWFVREAFHAHAPTMIAPYPRYAELAAQALHEAPFTAADLRDLQVWQKLVWIDPEVLAADPRARRLAGKGRGFDEADKRALRALELELLRQVVPAYREAAAGGDVELSTSPYFHPILPLLCDSAAHHAAHPGATLPQPPFRHPEDAALQLQRAAAAHERWFGVPPTGVWPSEGSVSDLAAAEVARTGFRWMASDEGILARSPSPAPLHAGAHCQPHALPTPAGEVRVLFRDHALSDLVGFTYQSWRAEDAVADFLARVRAGRPGRRRAWRRRPGGAGHPRRRERLGALSGRRPAVPSRALPWTGRGRRHRPGHDERRGGRPGPAAVGDLRRLVDQQRLRDLDRAPRRPPGLGTARRGPGPVCGADRCRRRPAGRRARRAAGRRGQRLVLVVRRRPLVGPRPGLRRAVPAPPRPRLCRARRAGARDAPPVADHHGGRRRRDAQARGGRRGRSPRLVLHRGRRGQPRAIRGRDAPGLGRAGDRRPGGPGPPKGSS